ncbi:trehalose-phosphatase [Pontibacter sp. KCTC 32443]|nr:trehalose-phosphatase [Pontibacter sp. KCTC 32443]MBC5773285.1 trehalose-phosphatase [Pontibacter sp. KCTC 32443]
MPQLLKGKKPAVFLDYDGCLTPIVPRPEQAKLSDQMRDTLQRLSALCFVAVVSGRDRANVEQLVQLNELYFAGSHGFDITGPDNMQTEPGGAKEALPALDAAQQELQHKLQQVDGVLVERKRYAIAVHFRNVPDEQVDHVKQVTEDIIHQNPLLKKGLGKKIIELKPNLDWHKGKAVLWLLKELKLDTPEILPVYIGDDITDEDAFAALQGNGVGILVGEHDDLTAATYRLEDVDEVQVFLEKMIKELESQKV